MHPECPDYDLCEKCESSPRSVHSEDHPMLKTKVPLHVEATSTMNVNGEVAMSSDPRGNAHRLRPQQLHQSGKNGIRGSRGSAAERREPYSRWYQQREHVTVAQSPIDPTLQTSAAAEPNIPGSYNITKNIYDQDDSVSNLAAPFVPDNKLKEELESVPEVQSTEGEVEEWSDKQGVTEKSAAKAENRNPAITESGPIKPPVTPLDIFSWVRHVTIHPGFTLPVGAEFTKTWSLKHFASGREYDFEKVKLVHKSEGLLGEACKCAVEFKRFDILAEEELEVAVHGLKVPDMPGQEIVEVWRFEDDKGVEYGQPLRLRWDRLLSVASELMTNQLHRPGIQV